jgi:phospholipid/cholesterol/gamma-HCH transport system permease protein
MIKAFTFAFLITSISAFQGFYIKGGAREVGIASTKAVVFSCIAILAGDYLITELLLP